MGTETREALSVSKVASIASVTSSGRLSESLSVLPMTSIQGWAILA